MRKGKHMSNKKDIAQKAKIKPVDLDHTGKHDKEELFFRSIVENLQSKITILDKDGTIRYQNIGYNVDDFYKPEEITGKTFIELVHPDYVQKVKNMFEALIKNPGAVKQMQIPVYYKDGSWHFLDIRAKSMLDIPEVAGIVVNSRDITDSKYIEDELKNRTEQLEHEIEDRKRAEDALRKSEEFFKAIVQNSYDSIVVIDEQGKRKYASSSFSNVGGYNSKEMLGKSVFNLIHPEDKAMVSGIFNELLDDPYKVHSLQARYLAKDGTYIWVEVVGVNMLGNPIVQGIVLHTRDITDRKMMEEDLHKSEERFRAIVQNSTDIIVLVDEKGINKYISPSFESITGYKIKDRLGKSGVEFIHPDDKTKVMKNFNQVLSKPDITYKGETRYLHSDGTYHWLEISAMNLIKDPNVNGIVLTFKDVSERKLSEQRLQEEMEITSQLLSLSEAVATITDVDKLMFEAVKSSREIMGCNITVSYLWDKQAGVFVPGEQVDMPNDILPFFRTENIDMKHIKNLINIRRPFLIRFAHSVFGENIAMPVVDVEEESITWLSFSKYVDIKYINTLLVIPLLNRDALLGIVAGIYFKKEHAASRFTERYYNAIIGIANQVSTALEQAKLYRESVEKTMELAHRIEIINTMYEIDRSILSNLTSEDVLNTVTRMAGKLLPCDLADIRLVDKDKHGFNLIASSGKLTSVLGSSFLFTDTSLTDVIKTGRPQYIPNLSEVNDIFMLERELLNNEFMSVMRIPLKIGNEVIGILSFGSKRISAFTHENLVTAERLGSQISIALANSKLISDLEESSMATIKSLSNVIDAKSKWTSGHSEGVAKYAIAIGRSIGLDEKALKELEVASLLHDIGKIGTYAGIIDKREKLTEEEWSLIKQHPTKGEEIIAPIKQLKEITPIIRYHHEFYDGTGYPVGLKGDQIPLLARILSVADAVDAMISDRPYRKGMSKDEVITELNRCSGTQFDPGIVETFLSIEDIWDL